MCEFLFLSRNPAKCAQLIKKRELHERIRCYTEILCSGYWIVKPKRAKRLGLPRLVSKSESKKQIVHWVTRSFMHFEFVLKVALAACAEYTLSSGADEWHPSEFALLNIEENMPPSNFFRHDYWDDPPQQIPIQYHTTDAVEGYRRWYKTTTLSSQRKRPRHHFSMISGKNKKRKMSEEMAEVSTGASLRVS